MWFESYTRALQWISILQGDKQLFLQCETILSSSDDEERTNNTAHHPNQPEGIYEDEDGTLRCHLLLERESYPLTRNSLTEEERMNCFRFGQTGRREERDCQTRERPIPPRKAILLLATPHPLPRAPILFHFATKLAEEICILPSRVSWHPSSNPVVRLIRLERERLYPFLRKRSDFSLLKGCETEEEYASTMDDLKTRYLCSDAAEAMGPFF